MIEEMGPHAALFGLSGVGIIEVDERTGRFVRANRAFCDLIGYHEAELKALTFRAILHPDDREGVAAQLSPRRDMGGGTYRARGLRRDGSVVWLELHFTPSRAGAADGGTVAVVNDISEWKRMEARLHEAEAHYRTLFASMGEAFARCRLILDDAGNPVDVRILEVNPAHEVMTGLSAAQTVGKTTGELVPEVTAWWLQTYGRTVLRGASIRFEHYAHTLGRWFEIYGFKAGAEDGTFALIYTDVTERKAAEAALRDSETRFHAFMDALPALAWMKDEEGRPLYMNKTWDKVSDFTPEAWRARADGDLTPPGFTPPDFIPSNPIPADIAESVQGSDHEVLRGDRVLEAVEETLAPDGRRRYWHSVKFPFQLSSGGRLVGGFAIDITARREAERALEDLNATLERRVEARTAELRRSERRFSRAFHAGPVAACITSFGRETFLEVNDAFLSLTGYARGEVVGRTSRELQMWSSPEDQRKLGEAQRNRRGFRNLELRLRNKAGEAHDILISAEVIHLGEQGDARADGHDPNDQGGAQDGYLKLFYDITERKRTEAQLHRAIGEVMSDTGWFSHKVLERLATIRSGDTQQREPANLSRREQQVLERLARGLGNDAIARDLSLSPSTVRNYISVVYSKLGVHSRAEAIVWARERGIIG